MFESDINRYPLQSTYDKIYLLKTNFDHAFWFSAQKITPLRELYRTSLLFWKFSDCHV